MDAHYVRNYYALIPRVEPDRNYFRHVYDVCVGMILDSA